MHAWEVRHGDCREVMATLDAESVDAVVCDPPYGLSFMGKGWDHGVPGVEFWTEALRVAKPGAHLLAFGGTRTYHRLACAIEDAGWEIRDCVMWVYGSGFPKSLDVGKAIDKRGGVTADFTGFRDAVKAAMKQNGVSRAQLQDALGNFMLSHYLTAGSQPAIPNWRDYRTIRDTVKLGSEFDALFNDEAEREVVGQQKRPEGRQFAEGASGFARGIVDITAPATPAARQWAGWGTALKPSYEPVIVARKPLVGTVAENVLRYGTGGINVDGCRVASSDQIAAVTGKATLCGTRDGYDRPWKHDPAALAARQERANAAIEKANTLGRWPANLIHDGSDEVVGLFPEGGSFLPAGRDYAAGRNRNAYGADTAHRTFSHGDSGSAARFFYCAKASRADRGDDNHHPTVKPTALMRYLCRLVTPPGGIVLDPFTGSGSTGKGAVLEGFEFIGIEREAEYVEIAKARIAAVAKPAGGLFA
jgi:DNA modification methylase